MTEPPEDKPKSAGDHWNRLKLAAFVLLGAPLLLASLPVLLPLLARLDARWRRRLRAAAMTTQCVRCGSYLGIAALELSDADWASYLDELHSSQPFSRLRVVRHVHAKCPHCAAEHHFDGARSELCLHDSDCSSGAPTPGLRRT